MIEAPYVKDMIDRCEFDTIYHEHLCYFSLTALDGALRAARPGRRGRRADAGPRRLAARSVVRWSPSAAPPPARRAPAGRGSGLGRRPTRRSTRGSRHGSGSSGESLDGLLGAASKATASRVAAYGAAAKGSTLLNVFGHRDRDARLRRRPQHRTSRAASCPASHLPIDPPERLLEEHARLPAAARLELRRRDHARSRHEYREQRRQVHRAGPDAGGGRAMIDGVAGDPAAAHPRRARDVMHMLRRTDPHFSRVRRDLLLDGVSGRRQGLAPAPRDDAATTPASLAASSWCSTTTARARRRAAS